ncbi:MAG: ABC transporter substrate-binding protein, partial [Bacillota bacterium]
MVRRPTVIALLTLVSLMVLVVSGISPALSKGKDVEIFSWWTAGGEANALNALIQEYEKAQPGMKIVNTAVAGGAGSVAKAVLVSRMMGNDPPDSFQVHAGRELIDTWVITKKMESLNDLFASEGWQQVMPKGILDIVSYKGKYWSVPVNIHRSNNIWYNKDVFQKFNLKPPTTFDEFFKVAEFLQSKGVIPCVMGSANGWEMGHVFEDVLAGVLGAEAYIGLWDGKTQWTDPRVAKALELFKRMLNYVNKDHAALTWDAAAEYLVSGKGAMLIQGDWAD